jgi:hypothetical protein
MMNEASLIEDSALSEIVFKVRHRMIVNVSELFNQFFGKMVVPKEDITDTKISFEAELESVSPRNEQRDEQLKSPVFFDVTNFPKLTFSRKELKRSAGKKFPYSDSTSKGIRLKMEELKTSIEENDPAAVDICREILSSSNLTDIQKNVLLELQTPLAAFEFDQAMDIIQKLS